MNPENPHSRTKKIPKKHDPRCYPLHFGSNTQQRWHILIVCELMLHENYTNAANYKEKENMVDF